MPCCADDGSEFGGSNATFCRCELEPACVFNRYICCYWKHSANRASFIVLDDSWQFHCGSQGVCILFFLFRWSITFVFKSWADKHFSSYYHPHAVLHFDTYCPARWLPDSFSETTAQWECMAHSRMVCFSLWKLNQLRERCGCGRHRICQRIRTYTVPNILSLWLF